MIVEIRTYRLKPGTGEEFVRLMQEVALPLLQDVGIEVVASGRSVAEDDGYESAYLIRRFTTPEERTRQKAEFYGSDVWLKGPSEEIESRIESYHTVVLEDPFLR